MAAMSARSDILWSRPRSSDSESSRARAKRLLTRVTNAARAPGSTGTFTYSDTTGSPPASR